MFAAGRQVWLGKPLAGQQVTLRLDRSTLHVFHDGQLIKTHPVTLDDKGLARLRAAGGKPARPSPAAALPPGPLPADAIVEVHRLVGAGGCVGIGGKQVSAASTSPGSASPAHRRQAHPHHHRRPRLARPCPPAAAAARGRLRGARLAGPAPAPAARPARTRVVSSQAASWSPG